MMTTYLRSKEIQDLKDPRPKIQSHYLHFEVPLWAIDSTLTESPVDTQNRYVREILDLMGPIC